MTDKINLTIDGIPIAVPPGTNVVDAAREAGVAVPVFCYHPRMEAVGMCRMCLVAVGTPKKDRATGEIEKDETGRLVIAMMPKLMTGCTTLVSEGMVVLTTTEEVQYAQRGVLEFLLTSHPLDCPVCDKGGECPLQNLTMNWGPGNSRFDYEDKIHFEKPVPLGDLILLDRERCILCGRCVRYQDEIAGDPVLGYSSRGRSWHIISKSDPPFDSKFSGNTTDICPVGALTTADFRFKARAWEVQSMPSICTHCPVGCNISLDMRHDKIMRVMPRENGAVNDIWICDKGRFAQHFIESRERLTTPLIRMGNQLVPVGWDEALQVVAEKFTAIQQEAGGEALAGLAGERLSNEDLYTFQRLFREVLQSNNLDHRVGAPGEPPDDNIGAELGVGVGTNLMELGVGTTVLVFGADPEEEAPVALLRLRGIAERGGNLVVANARPTKLDRFATRRLRYRPDNERHVAQGLLCAVLDLIGDQPKSAQVTEFDELQSALQGVTVGQMAAAAGVAEADIRAIAQSFVDAENGIIVYGAAALMVGPALTQDLGNLAALAGKIGRANNGLIALLPWGNSRGALDMGVRPDYGPGYSQLSEPGLSARELWGAASEGRVRGMYVMGLDPATDYPAGRPALEALDFLVVQDMFMTATAQVADVVLPAASFAERDGTYVNAERRVQRARQARPAPGECRADWMIVQGVAQALATMNTQTRGFAWNYFTVSDVAMDIAEYVPGYAGITHGSLAKTGRVGVWGRQTNEAIYYDGTNYENTEGIGLQYPAMIEQPQAGFSLKPQPVEAIMADERYPFVLMIQQLLYDGDRLLQNSLLQTYVPAAYVAINSSDAERLGITAGERVQVASSAGTLELPARVVGDLPEGSVVIPAYLPEAPLSVLQTGPRTHVAVSKV
jgi:NADH-quinone oxidoreductase subunit G